MFDQVFSCIFNSSVPYFERNLDVPLSKVMKLNLLLIENDKTIII